MHLGGHLARHLGRLLGAAAAAAAPVPPSRPKRVQIVDETAIVAVASGATIAVLLESADG